MKLLSRKGILADLASNFASEFEPDLHFRIPSTFQALQKNEEEDGEDDGEGDCEDDDDDDDCTSTSSTFPTTGTATSVLLSSSAGLTTSSETSTIITSITSTSTASVTLKTSYTSITAPSTTLQMTLTKTSTDSPSALADKSSGISSSSSTSTLISSTSTVSATVIRPPTIVSSTSSSAQSLVSVGQTAAEDGISSVMPLNVMKSKTEAGIIVAVIAAVLTSVALTVFFVHRFLRYRRHEGSGSSALVSPLYRTFNTDGTPSEYFHDMEQARPMNPAHSNSSFDFLSNQSSTIDTAAIFPATSAPAVAPSLGLRNNPVTENMTEVSADGRTTKVIIQKPGAFMTARQITIPRKAVQEPQVAVLENSAKPETSLLPGEWPKSLESEKHLPALPLAFDIIGRDEEGKVGKTKSVLLEPKPGSRWSDTFTVVWRGSGEAEGDNRWKSALSLVKDQGGRANTLKLQRDKKNSEITV